MKPVKCSWVDMLRIRDALAAGKRGDQSRLERMRCVDQSTVSAWRAACDVVEAIEGKHDICHVSTFQPSHARILARHFRKTAGKNSARWGDDTRESIVDWIEQVEAEELTVTQLKERLKQAGDKPSYPTCTVDDLHQLAASGEKFGCVYADPPWAYANQGTRAATGNHYDTMTVEEIASLPIKDLAADQSHLWLWTTNGFLFECPHIFERWGFKFKSSYVWVKPQIGIGNYLRNSHEFLLLAVRGGLTGAATDVKSWGEFARTEHSAKPEPIRRRVVERVSPGPYLELFGRHPAEGWKVWGNKIERGLFDNDVKAC